MPSLQSLQFDAALTNVSVAYRNMRYAAERIYPVVPVDEQTAKYPVFGKDVLRPQDDLRRPGTMSKPIDWDLSDTPYYCDGHALHSVIPDEWRGVNRAGLNLDNETTEELTEKMNLNREVALVSRIAADVTPMSQVSTPWNSSDNDPITLIDSQMNTVVMTALRKPNVLAISEPVFAAVRQNAMVLNRIYPPNLAQGKVTAQQLAEVLELDEVIVCDSVKVTSAKGQTVTADWIWGEYALLFVRDPQPGQRKVSLGYELRWRKGIQGVEINRGREDGRAHADWIEIQRYYDLKTIAAAGVLFTNTLNS